MPSKYDKINEIYHSQKPTNPSLTWTQAAHQAGFEGEWTSYKGKAKPRSGDARGQARRRASFDRPSTEMAGYEAKQLQQESTRISAEAEMFGLEPTQIEHLADQEDVRNLTAGSGGDPTNKAIVTQTEARFKDKVKQLAPRGYAVTLNPTTDSVRVIESKFFDPIADPSTLPGIDIPIGSDIEKGLAKIKPPKLIDGLELTPAQRRRLSNMPLEAKDTFITQLKKAKNLPGLGVAVGGSLAAAQLLQGKPAAAAETAFDTAVSEIPIIGDVLEPAPTADATLQGRTDPQAYAAQYKQEREQAKKEQSNFITDTLKLISDAI